LAAAVLVRVSVMGLFPFSRAAVVMGTRKPVRFPSRLREGLGEGVSQDGTLHNKPSPDPSRKREGRGEPLALSRYSFTTFDATSRSSLI